MTKLERLLFLQGNRCFFCDQTIPDGEATIEHLQPKSKGGGQDDDNCVVCCRTMNAMLGNLSVKDKLRALLSHRGRLICPDKERRTTAECGQEQFAEATTPEPPNSCQSSFADDVIEVLNQQFKCRPKKRSGLRNLIRTTIGEDATDDELERVISELERLQYLRLDGERVKYCSDVGEDSGNLPNVLGATPASVDEDIPF